MGRKRDEPDLRDGFEQTKNPPNGQRALGTLTVVNMNIN